MKHSTIYLIGARASGKTSVGKRLAKRCNLKFCDTDIALMNDKKRTIENIVQQDGWDIFRRYESETLISVSDQNNVIATGGGMILSLDNREYMKKNGKVFYLSASVETLIQRLNASANRSQRPSLTGKSIQDEVHEILSARHPLYLESAHHVINTDRHIDHILDEICSLL